jgi:hypothetical protein
LGHCVGLRSDEGSRREDADEVTATNTNIGEAICGRDPTLSPNLGKEKNVIGGLRVVKFQVKPGSTVNFSAGVFKKVFTQDRTDAL